MLYLKCCDREVAGVELSSLLCLAEGSTKAVNTAVLIVLFKPH